MDQALIFQTECPLDPLTLAAMFPSDAHKTAARAIKKPVSTSVCKLGPDNSGKNSKNKPINPIKPPAMTSLSMGLPKKILALTILKKRISENITAIKPLVR